MSRRNPFMYFKTSREIIRLGRNRHLPNARVPTLK